MLVFKGVPSIMVNNVYARKCPLVVDISTTMALHDDAAQESGNAQTMHDQRRIPTTCATLQADTSS